MDPATGAVRAVILDETGGRLIEVDWAPGYGFRFHAARLSAGLPRNTIAASLGGDLLLVADAGGDVFAVGRTTGSVRRLAGASAPAVITPDGRRILWAPPEGVLAADLPDDDDGGLAAVFGTQVLLAEEFDSPRSMVVLPDGDRLTLAIGCYGAVALVTLVGAGVTESRVLSMAHLAYDPVLVFFPRGIGPAARGPLVYAQDEGGVGLVAIDTRDCTVVPFPKDDSGYGAVRLAVPSLDSSACLVTVRGGERLLWSPGSAPRPIAVSGDVIAWQGAHALAIDGERGILCEIAVPAL